MAASDGGLRVLLRRAQWSPEQFARRLNRYAGELGLAARIDSKTPYKWLRGSHPREPWPVLAATLLGEALGSVVEVTDLGWRPGAASADYVPADAGLAHPWTAAGAVAVAAEAMEVSVLDRRVFMLLSGSTLTQPALEWLLASPATDLSSQTGRQVPAEHLDAVEEITAQLRRMDDQLGGGAVLELTRSQLRHVVELLRNGRYDEATGMRLHTVAAELLRIAGWSAWDSGQHPAAQRYWVAALRAAHAAGDRALGAYVLSLMSGQAELSGRHAEAVRLSEASLHGHRRASPRATAICEMHLAQAQAGAGDPNACHASVDRAWEALAGQPPQQGEPAWSYWMDDVHFAEMIGYCHLRLAEWGRAERHFAAAIRPGSDPGGRHGVLSRACLAEALAGKGDPEHACAVANETIDMLTDQVNSSSSVTHLRDVCTALRPYHRVPAVRELTERAERLPATPSRRPA